LNSFKKYKDLNAYMIGKIENLGVATALLFLRGSTTDRNTQSEVTIIRLKSSLIDVGTF